MRITAEQFNKGLLDTFPCDYPAGLQIVSHRCDECDQLEEDFVGREWAAIENAVIDRHSTDLPLFTPEALRYFLPSFLRAALENPSSNTAGFLMYSLAASGIHGSEVSQFSALQRSFVVTFLDLISAGDECVQDKVWAKTRARWEPT